MTLTDDTGKLRDLRYTVMDLPENELLAIIRAMTREELIAWLCWNDRNGVYRDEDSLAEFGNVMTKAEGEEIMFRQIMSERDDWDGKMDGKQVY